MSSDDRFESAMSPRHQDDLREQVSRLLVQRADVIASDAVAVFPSVGGESVDREYAARIAQALVRLLALAIRDAAVDARGVLVASLRSAVLERPLDVDQLFAFAYLTERTALDELALDDAIGATTEAWPLAAQLVRRGSFECLASFVSRARLDPANTTTTDTLTTLHTRAVLDTVLLKETDRAGRFGYALALILFDVDQLSAINETHGYGVGSRILERLGILLRKYFRQHDWVARYADDAIAVLLTGPDAEHAGELAERARVMVVERLGFIDHRTGTSVPVTVSAAVVNVAGRIGMTIDPERLLVVAEATLARAKQGGRNRVELASGPSTSRTLPHNSPSV